MHDRIPVKDVTASNSSPVKIHPQVNPYDTDRYGADSHIYVRKVEGAINSIRRYFGFIFLGLFAVLPWLTYSGRQAILLDIGAQRFNIFGLTLWPQDLTLMAWIFIIGAFALFFVTAFAGRVWCGFMCPQTTWTFIYIWFEEKIEGSANKRAKLDERSMDTDKFTRKSLKHFAWIVVALLTSLTFVGYFVPIHQLFLDFFTFQTTFWTSFFIIFFTVCTYGNAGWMREIMCTHICPYARFQSAMFDKDTFTVSYNANRGEKRGPRSRKLNEAQLAETQLGDCIDCNLCVQVCPTGIDIRNGLQYECINCGACIDACNGVMDKMGYPKGLISYTSEHQLSGGITKIIRPKLIGYAVVLFIMMGLLTFEIATRIPLEIDIIRDRNSLFRETSDGLIENVYTLKILNKSQQQEDYQISVAGLTNAQFIGDQQVTVKSGEVFNLPISIAMNPYDIEDNVVEFTIKIHAISNAKINASEDTKFLSY
jgi:cytochrome c oxidase accessory protein FixG